MQIPDSAALKPTNVTCEAWVWLDPGLPPHNGGEQIVFKKNTWTAWFEGYSLLKGTIDNGNGTYSDRFQFCVSRYGNQVAINSQTIAQRGVWYHIAEAPTMATSPSCMSTACWKRRRHPVSRWITTQPQFSSALPVLGRPTCPCLAASCDEASIYSRALSTNEIQAIYNAGNAGKCAANESNQQLCHTAVRLGGLVERLMATLPTASTGTMGRWSTEPSPMFQQKLDKVSISMAEQIELLVADAPEFEFWSQPGFLDRSLDPSRM